MNKQLQFTKRDIIVAVGVLGAGFLMGRSVVMENLRPFASAFVAAAGFSAGLGFAAAVGVCAGLLSTLEGAASLIVLAPPIMLALTASLLNRAGKKVSARQGVLMVLAVQLVRLPFGSFLLFYIARFICEAALAAGGYLLLEGSARLVREGSRPAKGDMLPLAVCALMLLCGIADIEIAGISPYRFITLALCAVYGLADSVRGGGIGAAAALFSLLCTADSAFSVTVVSASLLCGAFAALGRVGAVAGFVCGAALSYMGAFELSYVRVAECTAAALVLCVVPKAFIKLLSREGSLSALTRSEQMRESARQMLEHKLSALEACFSELSEVLMRSAPGTGAQRVSQIIDSVANGHCAKCDRRECCWENNIISTYRAMTEMMESGKGAIDQCPNSAEIARQLQTSADPAVREEGERSFLAHELGVVADVLRELKASAGAVLCGGSASDKAEQALAGVGIPCEGVIVNEMSRRAYIRLALPSCGGAKRCAEACAVLENVFGKPLRLNTHRCEEAVCTLTLSLSRSLIIACGQYQREKEMGICGDVIDVFDCDNYETALCLADGMGTGAQASAAASSLLGVMRRFLEGGFEREFAMCALNELLISKGGETTATADICVIDRLRGVAEFIKQGAAPSYIIRSGNTMSVFAPALPSALVSGARPATIKRPVMDGDVIVMLSDGIARGDNDAWLRDMLPNICRLAPKRAAKAIADITANAYGAEDDMSVIVARVERIPEAWSGTVSRWKARVG